MTTQEIQRIANRLRLDVMEAIYASGDGHAGPSMSIAEILSILYFERMNIRPKNRAGRCGTGLSSPRAMPAPSCMRPWPGGATLIPRSSASCACWKAACRGIPT